MALISLDDVAVSLSLIHFTISSSMDTLLAFDDSAVHLTRFLLSNCIVTGASNRGVSFSTGFELLVISVSVDSLCVISTYKSTFVSL